MSFQMLAHFSLLLLTTLFDISLNRICFLKLIDFVREFLDLQKVEQIAQFPYILAVFCSVSPIINILHWCGTFVTIDEPVLIHDY